MPITSTWVDPSAAGTLDKATGDVLTEGWMDSVASDLLVLGGTGGLTHTGAYSITGTLGVVGAASTAHGIDVTTAGTLTSTTQLGVYVGHTGSSAATSEIAGVYSQAVTAAASFTCAALVDLHAVTPAKGSGSTVTSAYGLLVDAVSVGNTNNYGIYVNTPSGGSGVNEGIHVAGGGINVVGGGVTIGGSLAMVASNSSRNKIATGVATSGSVGNNTATNVSVSFGFTYGTAPDVLVAVADSSDLSTINLWGVSRQSITTTGFNLQFLNRTGSTQSLFASWIAIGA